MNRPGHNLRWQNYVHPCLHKYAQDQLLLGEGVCRRLEIVNYHPKVEIWRGRCKGKDNSNSSDGIVTVPLVQIRELQLMCALPHHSTFGHC